MGKSTGVNLISGLIKKRAEVARQHRAALKVADAIKDDLISIDRTLVLCGYEGDPSGIEPRSKYKQLFGRCELKRLVLACLKDGLPSESKTARTLNTHTSLGRYGDFPLRF
jgi:hypothetical protein